MLYTGMLVYSNVHVVSFLSGKNGHLIIPGYVYPVNVWEMFLGYLYYNKFEANQYISSLVSKMANVFIPYIK